ncbi:protein kinase family protein [Natronobiforma cellulositropha]|uniref:hypothetical protein n=1 Tax=Natronobiforma cellulositropha TaxID=1679076 RepID=UPI0021D5A3CC|nr:hypothetical protein [Natronobiforma cellulositropha]
MCARDDDGRLPTLEWNQPETAVLRSFARLVLTPGVHTRHVHPGESFTLFPPPESATSERIGDWSAYDPADVTAFVPFPEQFRAGGHSAAYMETADLSDAPTDANVAFVTHYRAEANPETSERPPVPGHAHRRIVTFAFLSAMGVATPAHTFHLTEEWIAVEGIDGETVVRLTTRAANNVDRDEFLDQLAAQLLAGNRDLHEGNVFVREDGSVYCVDLDHGAVRHTHWEQVERAATMAADLAGAIDDQRTAPALEVGPGDVVDRTQQLASALVEYGVVPPIRRGLEDYDRILDAVGFSESVHCEHIAANVEYLNTYEQA